MLKGKNILVSTTSSLSGVEISQYLKPISAHVVAGTDFFSDFFASFTDVFGGRSKTYQGQLVTIYNEAIEQLKESAIRIGANAIIGLKVDLDEISGKGKSMFMVTAIGTAVIIDDKKAINLLTNEAIKVDLESIERLKQRKQIIEDAKSNELVLDDDNWNFIKSNRLYEVFDSIMDRYKKEYKRNAHDEKVSNFFDAIKEYISVFGDDVKSQLLYQRLITEDTDEIRGKLCELIENFNLLDFAYINKILESDDFNRKKISTRLLICEKSMYDKKDLEEIGMMLTRIKTCFPETGSYSSKKGLFNSKEKEVWTCACGKANNEIGETCTKCFRDISGFTANETTPPDAIEILEERKTLLSELLSDNN